MAKLSDTEQAVWRALEAEASSHGGADPAAHWVAVYSNLLALLDKGAAVSIGDRHGNDLIGVGLDEVRERLDFWRTRLAARSA